MSDPQRLYEFRCPIYGFVELNEWERDIVNNPIFQRLRRVRQLGLADYIYPGAMHTRFEHSIGALHMASMLYDGIVTRSMDYLKMMGYNETGLKRDKVLIRLTVLLHDIGHAPFSHASEELFPVNQISQTRYQHEEYSAELIRKYFKSLIEDHPMNTNYHIKVDEIINLLMGNEDAERALIWRELISGQIDADRMDYLLRDSHHTGVQYGRFDWRRLINTVEIIPIYNDNEEITDFRLGVNEGGLHAAEGLIIARYFMFTQVYYHRTRVVYDLHLKYALKEILSNREFPPPTENELSNFVEWDDWKVMGLIKEEKGGEHGERILNRDHFREIRHTPENPTEEDLNNLEKWKTKLKDLIIIEESATKSWYKMGTDDIQIVSDSTDKTVRPLSYHSSVVANIKPIKKILLYVDKIDMEKAEKRLKQ